MNTQRREETELPCAPFLIAFRMNKSRAFLPLEFLYFCKTIFALSTSYCSTSRILMGLLHLFNFQHTKHLKSRMKIHILGFSSQLIGDSSAFQLAQTPRLLLAEVGNHSAVTEMETFRFELVLLRFP